MNKKELTTPALIINADTVLKNIKREQKLCSAHGKQLRPHIKTHKITEFAKLQIEAGACGICCAKVSEAEVMALHGIKDIMIANEVIGDDKLKRLVALAKKNRMSVLVDSEESLKVLKKAFSGSRAHIGVYTELETGDSRCGASLPLVVKLAGEICKVPEFEYLGIETFGGFVFHCADAKTEKKNAKLIEKELKAAKKELESNGIEVKNVSVGGSPAFGLLLNIDIITELRPGVYIFNDAATVSRGGAEFSDCAATVLSTVISVSEDRTYAVLDGGGKTFSYCKPGVVYGHKILHGIMKGHPEVCLSELSEEHGIIDISNYKGRIKVGDVVEILPSHICPVINLADYGFLYSKKEGFRKIKIEARGKTQ